jgi:hypothetical protein
MTSTLPPDPPNFPGINYNPSFWSNSASTTGLTYNQALKNFLAFPVAQGTETLQNTNVNGTLTLINTTTPSETYSQYIDPNPNLDMTLSTTQTAGGLTIRTPTNSFTMNPNTFNQNLVTPAPVTGMQMLNPINMANFNIVNMGQYTTAYTQANNTNLDYVATCNYVNNMIVNGNGILDNPNVWTGTNEFQNTVSVTSNNGINIGAYGNLSNSSVLNPQIFVIQNKYQNDSAQIYFQMFNSAGVAQTPMNFTPTAVYCNLPLNLTNGSDLNMSTGSNLNMNSNDINQANLTSSTATTPPITDNDTSIATTAYVTTKVNNAVQIVRTGVTYIIPNSNVSATPQPVDNTISNTQSTIFLSLYFTPSISTVGAYGLNFNNNIYNGTYRSVLIAETLSMNMSTLQQDGLRISITSPTIISIQNISSGWSSGTQYFIIISLVISST